MLASFSAKAEQTIPQKLLSLSWSLIFLICAVMAIGTAALYSAAEGNFDPWASKQIIRFMIGFAAMIIFAVCDIRFWYRITWPIYIIGFILLIIVEVKGHIGMGAQRWINLGFMQVQPSEIMKIAVIMALARHFHGATPDQVRRLTFLIVPAMIIIAPVCLVLLQPNLGTSLIIIMVGAGIVFMAGAPLWLFIGGITAAASSIPIAWMFMHDYQKRRVTTFLNPESDPLGAGYHIAQSKIALGSGGWDGKGFLQGSQSRLNFLPEKETDFIFTLWAEEWGFVGGMTLLVLLALIFMAGLRIALLCKHNYGRYMALGLSINFSMYVFINVAMVMGLIPVVGIPLPLVSYGGTSMLAVLIGFGLMMSCYVHRHSKVTR